MSDEGFPFLQHRHDCPGFVIALNVLSRSVLSAYSTILRLMCQKSYKSGRSDMKATFFFAFFTPVMTCCAAGASRVISLKVWVPSNWTFTVAAPP